MNKLFQVIQNVSKQCIRNYAFKSDLKIKWIRPEKIPCIKPEKSGDLSKLPPIPTNEFLSGYKDSKELQNADESVQSLFKLENNSGARTTQHYCEKLVAEVQRHPLDFGSMEARLARMTALIRRKQEHMEKWPRDKYVKVKLKELIDKRKKYLKYLRRWDYRRFEWILEKLDLVYKPPPAKFHWITRKESLVKLTDIYCEKIREERLEAYHKQLKEQQIPFLEEAIEKMLFVRKEQISCDVPVTVTLEQIEDYKSELEALKKLRDEDKAATEKKDADMFD